MPVVPIEQNRVGIAEVSGAKMRAPDRGGGVGEMFAQGMGRIAAAAGEYAITQDEIQDNADKLAARNLALEYKARATKRAADYKSLQGVNAVNASARTQADLDADRDEVLGMASNARQRSYLEPMVSELHPEYMNSVYDHSKKEQFQYSNDTYASEAKTFGNEAAGSFGDPAKQAKAFAGMDAALDRLGHLNGWGPEQLTEKKLELRGAVHVQAVDLMLAQTDADVGGAAAYYAAHKGEMTVAQQAAVEKDLQKPLEWRQAQDDIAGIAPVQTKDGGIGVVVSDTLSGTDALKAAIRGPESAGDDKVGNKMGSTASGRYQFTEGTFKNLYGKVFGGDANAAWSNNRFDANVQEKLMDRLIKDNTKILNGAGIPVNNGTLYVMHVLGGRDGPKVLKADANTPVASLLSAEIVAKNPTYFGGGKTVGQSIGIITGKVGGKVAPTGETPQEWNKDAAYDAIDARAKAEGWTPERTERAKQAMDVKVQRDEQMLGRQREQADEAAFKTVLDLGDGFTSMNQISRSTRDKMSPQMLARLQEQAQRNLTAKTTVPDDTMDSLYLQRLSREAPQDFGKVDLGRYVGKISNDDMKKLWLKQGDVRGNPPKDDDIRGGITKAMTFGQKYGGAEVKDKDWPAVYDTMEGWLLSRKSKKGSLDPADYDDAFKFAVRTRDSGNKNYEVFRDQIPPEFEAEVRKNWRGPNKPTRGQIIEAWVKYKGGA